MDKLERLLNLTAALLHAETPLTADDLRDRVGGYPEAKASFRRAFERDKDDLRGMGMPLRVEPVPGVDPPVDGYRLDRDEYAGADLSFEPDELAALHLATNLVRLDGDEAGLIKLGAAADRQAVEFSYRDATRVVEPWRLSFSRGHWYLNGWDRLREDDRLYRVDRIQSDVTVVGAAEHPVGAVAEPLDLRGWELGDGDPVTVSVRVDADQAAYARHMLDDVDELDDGGVVARLQVRNVDGLRSFVLSFLEHAEILEPTDLRDDFIAWLEAQR